MTFTEAVAKVENALLCINLTDRRGDPYTGDEMTVKLDLYFDSAWSELVNASLEGSVTNQELCDRGLVLARTLARTIDKRRMMGTLLRLEGEESA